MAHRPVLYPLRHTNHSHVQLIKGELGKSEFRTRKYAGLGAGAELIGDGDMRGWQGWGLGWGESRGTFRIRAGSPDSREIEMR